MPIRDEAINVFMGLPGDGDRLELTYNHGVDSYELGTGYNHIALTVDDLDGTLEQLPAGHRAREAALPRARGRLADLLRARPGRLPDRAHRARQPLRASNERRRTQRLRGSPSSTSGRTRSGWSSSPTPTAGGSAPTRSTRPVRIGEGSGGRRAAAAGADGARARDDRAVRALLRGRPASSEVRPVATTRSASASNREEFLAAARERSGLDIEVLSREEEARYGYLAAVNSTTLDRRRVLDLGGGSMQLTRVKDREARDARSWPLGAVRMTERFLDGTAPRAEAPQGAARARRASSSRTRPWLREAGGASSASAARCATSPPRRSSPPAADLRRPGLHDRRATRSTP